jgi:hypothetical protein
MKNLRYCVSLVQQDNDDYSAKMFQKYVQYAINTYRKYIQNGIDPTIDVFYATANDLGLINMPLDYEYYTKVGVLHRGKLYTLTLNPNLPINNRIDTCGDLVDDLSNMETTIFDGGYPFVGHYRAGNYVGELYGLGGGINAFGYFNEDKKNRQIQTSSLLRNESVSYTHLTLPTTR